MCGWFLFILSISLCVSRAEIIFCLNSFILFPFNIAYVMFWIFVGFTVYCCCCCNCFWLFYCIYLQNGTTSYIHLHDNTFPLTSLQWFRFQYSTNCLIEHLFAIFGIMANANKEKRIFVLTFNLYCETMHDNIAVH